MSQCPKCKVPLRDGMCTRCSAVYAVSTDYKPKNSMQHVAGPVPAALLAIAGVAWGVIFTLFAGRMLVVAAIGMVSLLAAAWKVLNTPRDIDDDKTWFQ